MRKSSGTLSLKMGQKNERIVLDEDGWWEILKLDIVAGLTKEIDWWRKSQYEWEITPITGRDET